MRRQRKGVGYWFTKVTNWIGLCNDYRSHVLWLIYNGIEDKVLAFLYLFPYLIVILQIFNPTPVQGGVYHPPYRKLAITP